MPLLHLHPLNHDETSQLFLPSTTHNIIQVQKQATHADHSFLYIIDSLGIDLLTPFFQDLTERYGMILTSVFPSVTPVAFTSLITGMHPLEHGIFGHYYYNSLVKDIYDHLRFPKINQDRTQTLKKSFAHLSKWSLKEPDQMIFTYLPKQIIHGLLTHLLFKHTTIIPYTSLQDITPILVKNMKAHKKTKHIIYFNELDGILHEYGKSRQGYKLVAQGLHLLKTHLLALKSQLQITTTPPNLDSIAIQITADHGQINTPENKRIIFPQALWDNIQPYLRVTKIGRSGRVYHVFPQLPYLQTVKEFLQQALSSYCVVLTDDEFRKQQHQVQIPHSAVIHLITRPEYSLYSKTIPCLDTMAKANHGSLTREELFVPFISLPLSEIK